METQLDKEMPTWVKGLLAMKPEEMSPEQQRRLIEWIEEGQRLYVGSRRIEGLEEDTALIAQTLVEALPQLIAITRMQATIAYSWQVHIVTIMEAVTKYVPEKEMMGLAKDMLSAKRVAVQRDKDIREVAEDLVEGYDIIKGLPTEAMYNCATKGSARDKAAIISWLGKVLGWVEKMHAK
jgi:hypothetical protein